MRTSKQFSVTLVNKPGRLSAMLTALGKEKVGFQALSVMDSGERGTLRFVPDNEETASEILQKGNIRYEVADVLLVEVPPQHGAFQKICERLASEHLNIDYAYCGAGTDTKSRGGTLAVIKVNDLAKAQKALSTNGSSRRKQPGRRPVHAR